MCLVNIFVSFTFHIKYFYLFCLNIENTVNVHDINLRKEGEKWMSVSKDILPYR